MHFTMSADHWHLAVTEFYISRLVSARYRTKGITACRHLKQVLRNITEKVQGNYGVAKLTVELDATSGAELLTILERKQISAALCAPAAQLRNMLQAETQVH